MQVCVIINCIVDHYLVINTIDQINQKQNILVQSLECTLQKDKINKTHHVNNYKRFI